MSVPTRTVRLGVDRTAAIRKLTWKQMREAGKRQFSEGVDQMKEFGAELVAAIQSSKSGEDAADKLRKIEESRRTAPSSFEMGTVLTHGVVSIDDHPATPEDIEGLDAGDADTLHRAIVEFSFETVAGSKNA